MTDSDEMHVMISYNWDHQPLAMRIKVELEKKGYKTWIDLDNMSGNINRAMAEGVEGACAMLMCVTQSYKKSFNCEKEAGYADSLRKPIVPLRLEPGCKFDGWVGPIVGSRLYFDFSNKNEFTEKIEALDAELALNGIKEKAKYREPQLAFLEYDVDDLAKWLRHLKIDTVTVNIFKDNCVTGKDLSELSKEELIGEDFKIRPFVATKILRNRDEAMGMLPLNITARCSTPSQMGKSMPADSAGTSKREAATRKDKLAATTTHTVTVPKTPSTKEAIAAASKYKKGDACEVYWSSSWFPSVVVQTGPRYAFKINYDGYDSSSDEKVDVDDCRWKDKSKIKNPEKVKVGDKLEVRSGSTWYDASIVDILLAVCQIRYDGYGSEWDTWVLPDEIRKTRAPDSTASVGSKYVYKVNDRVKICWANSWYTGYVLEEGPHVSFKIHYNGWNNSYDESVDLSVCKRSNGIAIKSENEVNEGDKLQVLWGGTWYESHCSQNHDFRVQSSLRFLWAKLGHLVYCR
ncbi:uncharacterized protein LOC100378207 [Saccoglossus kowalevskii]